MWQYILLIFVLFIILAYYWSHAIFSDLERLKVYYDGNLLKGVPKMSIQETSNIPVILYPKAIPKKLYTLMLVDPTAPDTRKPDSGPWRHWLVVDIPGFELLKPLQNIEQVGKVISSYVKPNPPVKSGRHIYQIQIYEQPGKLLGPQVRDERRNWNIDQFIQAHNLYKLEQKTFTIRAIGSPHVEGHCSPMRDITNYNVDGGDC
jgi:phosphatidylethanolamine-binding protein (PEBP) family uncharacterized protein